MKTEKLKIKVFLWNWNIAGIPKLVSKNGRRIDMTYKTWYLEKRSGCCKLGNDAK